MEKVINFGDIKIQKQKFRQHKETISMKNIDIKKIVVSNKVSFVQKRFKYFIAYKDAKKIRPLCIFHPKMTAFRKDFDETKFMSLLIKDDQLLEKYNEIWEKVRDTLKREFDSKPVYNKKYLKAKIKPYNEKTNTNFHNNKIPIKDYQYICLSIILLDFVFRAGKNYYPQVLLEECKHVVPEKKIPKYIIDDRNFFRF